MQTADPPCSVRTLVCAGLVEVALARLSAALDQLEEDTRATPALHIALLSSRSRYKTMCYSESHTHNSHSSLYLT